jgi:hypothetical protein
MGGEWGRMRAREYMRARGGPLERGLGHPDVNFWRTPFCTPPGGIPKKCTPIVIGLIQASRGIGYW